MRRFPTMVAIAWLALSGCERAAPPPVAAISPAESAVLFHQRCALCHGEIGDGQGPRRGSLFRKPPDFRDPRWRARTTRALLMAAIRDGRPGTDMASWRALGEPAIAGLADHVLRLGEPTR